ncbi:MAG: lipid-A-disaccharide synthase [bacterium]
MANLSSTTILMVSGEASGDLHGGNLAREIFTRLPQAKIYGLGGPQMQRAGVQVIGDINNLAVVGISEVLIHWRAIWQTFRFLRKFIKESRPDLIVLIDYPDFNLRLAKVAKKEQIRVLYYISPQVWAWRRWRIKTMAQYVDILLVVFAFELSFYQEQRFKRKSKLDVRFVGHPLVDIVRPNCSREKTCFQLGVDPRKPIIGLLPGSRRSEVSRILPSLLKAAQKLIQKRQDIQFLLALAPTISYAEVEPYLQKVRKTLPISCHADRTYDIISISDLVLVSSGTATLETALLNTPMVLIYRLSPLSYLLGKLLIRVPYIGLVNLVAGKKIIPELIQHQASPEKIASLADALLQNLKGREIMRQEFQKVREKLGEFGSSGRAADIVLEILEQ